MTYSTPGGVTYDNKIARQMLQRDWTPKQIDEAVAHGVRINGQNFANGNPSTRYVNPGIGQSVVIDEITNSVVQAGKTGFLYGPNSDDLPDAVELPPSPPFLPPDDDFDSEMLIDPFIEL